MWRLISTFGPGFLGEQLWEGVVPLAGGGPSERGTPLGTQHLTGATEIEKYRPRCGYHSVYSFKPKSLVTPPSMTEGTSGIFLQSSRKRSACRLHCLEAVEVVIGVVMWGSPPPDHLGSCLLTQRDPHTSRFEPHLVLTSG